MSAPPSIQAGYWAMPACKSSNSYHRYADEKSPSLCGRWPAGSHTREKDARFSIIAHMDCRKCQKLFLEQRRAIADRWVSTYSAHRAWVEQTRPTHCSRSTFQRIALKRGVRHWLGMLIWDGYWWHAADVEALMATKVPFSQSDSIGERPHPVCL